jgi:hypothetical protein
MTDILQGLIGGGQVFLFAWVLPTAIVVSAVRYFVLPAITGFPGVRGVLELDATSTALGLAFASVAVALVLSALSTQLYRVLEGYSWPRSLRDIGRQRQLKRKQMAKSLAETAPVNSLERALAYEELRRFPDSDEQVAPSRLGNAIRAFETYAEDRYQLNSQLLWVELYVAVPDALRAEHDQARASVDFFVNSIWQLAILGVTSLVVVIFSGHFSPLILFLVVLAAEPLFYRGAISSTSYWRSAVQAIVDTGRVPLATNLGLVIPDALEEERQMWQEVARFVFYEYKGEDKLDNYRKQFRSSDSEPTEPTAARPERNRHLGDAWGSAETYERRKMVQPTVASEAVETILSPCLPELVGSEEGLPSDAERGITDDHRAIAASLWARLHTQVLATPAAMRATEVLAEHPNDADAQTTLQVQLHELFERDPRLLQDVTGTLEVAERLGVVAFASGGIPPGPVNPPPRPREETPPPAKES